MEKVVQMIECRDCGAPTWNRTERCGTCKDAWRNGESSLEEKLEVEEVKPEPTDEIKWDRYQCPDCNFVTCYMQPAEPTCVKCSVKNALNNVKEEERLDPSWVAMASHVEYMKDIKGTDDMSESGTCKECGESSITLINGTCNTCLSTKDDSDVINWPKHYNTGKIQPIDAIEDWQLDFRLANAVKYIARHQHKENPKKDLEKAVWYIQRYIDKELTKEGNNGES